VIEAARAHGPSVGVSILAGGRAAERVDDLLREIQEAYRETEPAKAFIAAATEVIDLQGNA
jgi:hypothetical protein